MQDKQYPHTCDVYSLSKYIQTSDERGCFPIAFREIFQIYKVWVLNENKNQTSANKYTNLQCII